MIAVADRQISAVQVRGTCVGAVSGAVSVCAHGLGSGTMDAMRSSTPSAGSILLLTVACGVLGAIVADLQTPRRDWLFLCATLGAGQVLGHTMLALHSGHAHAPSFGTGMLAAHAGAVVVSAAVIRAVEFAYRIAMTVWERVRLLAGSPAPVLRHALTASVVREADARQMVLTSGVGTRGPPLVAAAGLILALPVA